MDVSNTGESSMEEFYGCPSQQSDDEEKQDKTLAEDKTLTGIEEDGDDVLEDTIPYGEEAELEEISGSSEYVTPNETPPQETRAVRRSTRVKRRKPVFTYGSNFEPKIKRFDLYSLLNK